jgi:hypothetical protein
LAGRADLREAVQAITSSSRNSTLVYYYKWITSTTIPGCNVYALVFLSKGSAEESKSEVRCSCFIFWSNYHSPTTSYSFACITSLQSLLDVLICPKAIRYKTTISHFTSIYNRGYFTTDGQSVSISWYRVSLWDLRPDITSCRNVCLKFAVLFLWGTLSHERMVCNFQRNHSMVRVAQNP